MSAPIESEVIPEEALREIREHRKWFTIAGALLLLTGIGAIVFPMAAGFAMNVVIGVSLLVAGGVALAFSAMTRSWRAAGISFAGGLVDVVVGALMLLFPVAGVSALAMLLIFWFLLAGAMRTSVGWQQRPNNGWLAFMIAGGLSVLLGLVILFGWPAISAFAIGIMVGVHFILGGVSLLALTRSAGGAGESVRSTG